MSDEHSFDADYSVNELLRLRCEMLSMCINVYNMKIEFVDTEDAQYSSQRM